MSKEMKQQETQITNEDLKHRELQIIREINIQAENFYENAVEIGDHAAYALKRNHRSQMTGLENIADSALKTSDILDYIKRQTARFTYWRQNYPGDAERNYANKSDTIFGERLKNYLETELVKKRDMSCSAKRLNIGDKTDEDRQVRRRIYLLLIRQFIRQMVVQYEYRVNFSEDKKGA